MGWPVAASQSRAVLSQLPVSDGLAVGAERHGTDSTLMLHGRPDGLAGGRVPEPRRLVHAAGEDGLAVGAERHRSDSVLVLHRQADGLAGGRVPEPRRVVALPVSTPCRRG